MTCLIVFKAVVKSLLIMIQEFVIQLIMLVEYRTSLVYRDGQICGIYIYFNVIKCKILHIGKNNQEIDYKMKLSEDNYDNTVKYEEEKDLGIIFDKYISFDAHIQNSINTANSMVGIIRRTLDGEIFTNLYKSLVRPHLELEYGNI